MVSMMRDNLSPAQRRARFLKLLDRPRVPLDPKISVSTRGLYVTDRGTFASEPGERVPFLLQRPADDKRKRPAVLVLHGTGGNKEGNTALLSELAERGFVALAIYGRYNG